MNKLLDADGVKNCGWSMLAKPILESRTVYFRKCRPFTLLEVMVAIVLLAIGATFTGIRIYRALEDKHFQTDSGRLLAELDQCQQLALNMQADWSISIEQKKGRIVLDRCCLDTLQTTVAEWDAHFQMLWNDRPFERLTILFYSTGTVAPRGELRLVGSHATLSWRFPELFSCMDGSDGAIPRPDCKKNF